MSLELSTVGMTHVREPKVTLQELNDAEFYRRLAPIIYLSVLIIIGIPGNVLVFCIYKRHVKKSVHRVFIMSLALVDFLICLTCLPFEIIEMRFQYTFYNVGACKFFRANNVFLSIWSIVLVLGMSIDRYQRVCNPLRQQLSTKTACYVCVGTMSISLIFHWPSYFLTGTRLVKLTNNITGYDCSISDEYAKTKFPLVYMASLFLGFLGAITTLIVVYSCICRTVYVQRQFRNHLTPTTGSKNNSKSSVSDDLANLSNETEVTSSQISASNSENFNESQHKYVTAHKQNTKASTGKRSSRVTKIAFVISVVFILSYVPYLVLNIITAIKGEFLAKPGPIASALLPIVTRSVYINNIANPFVYGVFDPQFRQSCKYCFFRLCK